MTLDASIYQALPKPMSVADYDAQAAQRDQNRLQLLLGNQQLESGKQSLLNSQLAYQKQNALMKLALPLIEGFTGGSPASSPAGPAAPAPAAPSVAPGAGAAPASPDTIALHAAHLKELQSVQTPEDALKWANDGKASGLFTPDQYTAGVQRIQAASADPQSFAQWKDAAVQGGTSSFQGYGLPQASKTVTPPQMSKLASMTQDQIAGLTLAGVIPKEFAELWQASKFGKALPPGWKQNLDGTMTYVPDPTKGVTVGADGVVSAMPGAAETQAALAAATKGAEARATNQNTLLTPDQLERRPGVSPNSTVDDIIAAGQAARQPAMQGLSPTGRAAVVADMQREGVQNATVQTPQNPRGAPVTLGAGPLNPQFKTSADLAAEKAQAEANVKIATDPKLKYVTKVADDAAAAKGKLDDEVINGQALMLRIGEANDALKNFKPGMGSEARLTAARTAQALGLPDSIVTRINNGDVAAKQEFVKLSAQTAMESLKQAMGSSGRITQSEFKVFQANNPNIELDPNAIAKIHDFATRVYQNSYREQQGRQQFIDNGGDPASWPAVWAKQQDPGGTGAIAGGKTNRPPLSSFGKP